MLTRRNVGIIVLGLAVCFAGPALAGEKVVQFRIKGQLPEAPPKMDISVLLSGEEQQSMFDLLKKLNKIRTDDEVSGVIFELDEAAMGFAQIQELRQQFQKLRAADKDVWVYAETLTPGQYLLASAASKLVMMPKGELVLLGIHAEASYFKNLLDKIGVQADIIHIGDYKSAGEPFYRTEPSKEAEEQENKLLDSIFEQMVEQIAESRKISAGEVRKAIDHGLFSPEEAQKAKLVDELMYRSDLKKAMKRKYGEEVKVTRNYDKERGPELDFSNPFTLIPNLISEFGKGSKKSGKPAVAVIYVDSMITSGSSEDGMMGGNSGSTTISRAIDKAAADDTIKAVVLRVDSPGGSAIASDVIAESVGRCKKEKPVVVSMGNVAASGGYYVSCLADWIFADPGTITGSIGVVGGKMVTKGFWDWIGVTGHEYKRGARSDIMTTSRKFNEDERKFITDVMLRVYGDFKDRVTTGRGKKIKGDLEKLAGGRVYSGKDALGLGLVDQLGGLGDAVKYAAEKAEVSKYEMRVLPEPKTIFDMIFKSLLGKDEDEDAQARIHYGSSLLASPVVRDILPMIDRADPMRGAAVRRMLMQVDLLGRENVMVLETSIPSLR